MCLQRRIVRAPTDAQPTSTSTGRQPTSTDLVVNDKIIIEDNAGAPVRAGGEVSKRRASSAAEALEIVDATREAIHLLVTDVVLPEFDGWELADSLASAPFLQKPFNASGIAIAVRATLDGTARWRD